MRTVLILTVMVGISCLVIFRRYLFGGEPIAWIDIGSDTSQLYLPQYAGIIHQLKSGDFSLWNWRDGFGVNMNLFNLTNPMLILVYLYGAIRGIPHLAGVMVWILCLEMYLSGLFTYLYLSVFPLDERAKCLSSYMYAFSGFILIWGQHYQFGAIYFLVPLMLLFTERMIRNAKAWKALVIMTAVVVVNSMYTGYMTLLMCAAYVMLRFWMREEKGFVHWLKRTVQVALTMILGVGVSAFALLPSAIPIFTVTSRMKSNLTVFQKLFLTELPRSYYKALFYRTFTTTGMGISDYHGFTNYYEDPCLFFSTLFILLAIQYIFLIPGMKLTKRNRVLRYVMAGMAVLSAGTATVGVLMNGLAGSFSRYMFLFMPYFACVSAETLHEIFQKHRVSIAALLLGLAAIAVSYWKIYHAGFYPEDNEHIKVLLASGGVMGILLLPAAKLQRKTLIAVTDTALGVLLMVNVISDGASDFEFRYSTAQCQYHQEISDKDTIRAIEEIQKDDPQFYRIEKTYHAVDGMDGMVQDYPSVSGYNSTQNGNIQKYVETYWKDLIYKDQNHYLFENGRDNAPQSNLTGVKYVLAEKKNAKINGFSFDRMIGDIAVFKNAEVENIASFYPDHAAAEEKITGDEVGAVTKKITVEYKDRDKASEISLPKPSNSGSLKGTVKAGEDGYLFLAVPYENGWTVSVDGQEQQMLLADEGFIAVHLPEGTHTVTVRFRSPGLSAGIAISICSLVILIFLGILEQRKAGTRITEKHSVGM